MCEIKQIEQYLLNTISPEEKILMDAKLLLDKNFRENLLFQKQTYALVQQYGRKQLKLEIENVHRTMFSDKRFQNFRTTILTIFQK